MIANPCIDATNAGFNTEQLSEFTLLKAYDECPKAWFVRHLLEAVFDGKAIHADKQFVFNMRVGYDLTGIKTDVMQAYIGDRLDASYHPKFTSLRATWRNVYGTPWTNRIKRHQSSRDPIKHRGYYVRADD
ncbi:hypothetical protein [Shewanella sp.]|uniref:hypothetical protein n=1 Tax=Shewanella sp. TaxID=50422 RepID=UPI003A97E1D4